MGRGLQKCSYQRENQRYASGKIWGGSSYNLQNVVIIENSSGGALRERSMPPTTKEQENETAWNVNIS